VAGAATAGAGDEAGRPQGTIAIIKPRVLLLLVFVGLTGAVVAGGKGTDPVVLLPLLAGGLLSVGAANILNNVLDKDRDSLMSRTMWRPLPAGTVRPATATVIAVVIGAAGVGLLWYAYNALTALLTVAGILFYIVVYTSVLKSRTPQNIVLGGFAGAFPALVGWTAVTGSLGTPPLIIGLLVVLWTPPHFWSLALLFEEDYRKAGVPMLPVVKGERATRTSIAIVTVMMVVASFLYIDVGGWGLYLVGVALLDAPMVVLSCALLVSSSRRVAWWLFKFSSVYLALLLVLMMVESVYPRPIL